jgi:cytochrome c
MKKTLFSLALLLGLFATSASARSLPLGEAASMYSTMDSTDFIGKYKYEGLPFEYMEISTKEGKLYYSGGEYTGYLEPVKDKKDVFDAGGIAIFTFTRDSQNKVKELMIDYQGQTHIGKKEGN